MQSLSIARRVWRRVKGRCASPKCLEPFREGRRGQDRGEKNLSMIRVNFDDSKLTSEYRAFLKEWADTLGVSLAELLGRILIAAVEGEQYVEKMPTESENRVLSSTGYEARALLSGQ